MIGLSIATGLTCQAWAAGNDSGATPPSAATPFADDVTYAARATAYSNLASAYMSVIQAINQKIEALAPGSDPDELDFLQRSKADLTARQKEAMENYKKYVKKSLEAEKSITALVEDGNAAKVCSESGRALNDVVGILGPTPLSIVSSTLANINQSKVTAQYVLAFNDFKSLQMEAIRHVIELESNELGQTQEDLKFLDAHPVQGDDDPAATKTHEDKIRQVQGRLEHIKKAIADYKKALVVAKYSSSGIQMTVSQAKAYLKSYESEQRILQLMIHKESEKPYSCFSPGVADGNAADTAEAESPSASPVAPLSATPSDSPTGLTPDGADRSDSAGAVGDH